MGTSGLSAAIQMAARLELDFSDMEVLSFGRGVTSDTDIQLEIGGRFLLYSVTLSGEIRLDVAQMDSTSPPEQIVRFADTAEGWDTLRRLCGALERNGIRSMHPRPVEVPSDWEHPDDGWIIA
jgi:hypothetical protein